MSDFGKAFRREFGKNTGKFISNVVFGDRHSTPYRRVEAARQERHAEISARHVRQMQIQQDRLRERSRKNDLLEERNKILHRESQARIRDQRKDKLYAVDSAINTAIDNLLATPIPTDVFGLEQYILDLTVQLNASKSEGFSDEREIRRKYQIALRERFFQSFNRLETVASDSYVIDEYVSAYEDLRYEKYCEETPEDGLTDELRRLIYILKCNIPATGPRLANELEILIHYIRKPGGRRDDSLAGYTDKAHERCKIVAERLAELDPGNPLIDTVREQERIIRKLKRRRQIAIRVCAAVLIFAMLCLFFGRVFFWSCLTIVCLVPITYYSIKYYQRNSHKLMPRRLAEGKSGNEACPDDIFIDLNLHNRIGEALKDIWDRYKEVVPPAVYDRLPIFAADGVKESILFVGINPSYNPSDDQVLINVDGNRSLMYGSFYKRSDAPDYFKALEEFASDAGFAYSQMNLLYFRENDRSQIAKLDSEFIREQLELTYETIRLLQPRAIVFMSDWCRQMIDGPGRWVDSKSSRPDDLTLNGTDIPVFFSDDVFILDKEGKNSLSRRIKMRLMP